MMFMRVRLCRRAGGQLAGRDRMMSSSACQQVYQANIPSKYTKYKRCGSRAPQLQCAAPQALCQKAWSKRRGDGGTSGVHAGAAHLHILQRQVGGTLQQNLQVAGAGEHGGAGQNGGLPSVRDQMHHCGDKTCSELLLHCSGCAALGLCCAGAVCCIGAMLQWGCAG